MPIKKSSRAELFAALKPKIIASGIDGFKIRQLSVAEVDSIRAAMTAEKDTDSFGLRLVAMSVIDAGGDAVLTAADIPELKAASNDLVEKLTGQALELNGFIKAAAAKN